MRYAISITLLALVCLAANAFAANDSSVDSFIENSQSGKGEWESSDAFGATIPAEARDAQQASSEDSSAGTTSSAVDASDSLVDDYIEDSLNEEGEMESNDAFGAATPNEARKVWISELQNNTTLQDNVTAENTTATATAAAESAPEVESLVDDYIADSQDFQGEWESDDAFGFATPGEARKAVPSNNESQS
jgi:hypothetical protein